MKRNLKELAKEKEALKEAASIPETKRFRKLLNNLVRWLEEVETDLELGGESIVELDKERLAAIEERDRFIQFLKHSDDT